MDTNEILHTRIEAYLSGMLDPAEKAAFEQQLASDSALRNEVQRHRKAALALQHGLNQTMKERLRAIDKELGMPQKHISKRTLLIKRLSIAAGFLVLVAAGMHFYAHQTYSTTAVAEDLFAPAPAEQFRDREEYVASLGEKFAEAERLFRAGDYNAAKQQYLVIIHEDSLLKGQAEWNLALCHFAMDPSSAQFKMLFDRILNDTRHDYHDQAIRLNKTMESTLYKLVNR